MNTKHTLIAVSNFKLENTSRAQQIKDSIKNKKKNSYLAIKTLKENLNSLSFEKSPMSAKFSKTDKENQSPLIKISDINFKSQLLNKSLKQIPQNKAKNPLKIHARSKSFIIPEPRSKNSFKIFSKSKQLNEKEEESFENLKNNFNNFESFQMEDDSNELKDITNSQNLIGFNSFEASELKFSEESYQNDPNVMTLKELKIENEEELSFLVDRINKKTLENEKKKEKISYLEQKKLNLSIVYQDLIKEHSLCLQEIQEEIMVYKDENEEIVKEIEKENLIIKKNRIEKETKEIQIQYFEIEKKLKDYQEKSEDKSNDLFLKINNLNEELTNYNELLIFKKRNYESAARDLKTLLELKENKINSNKNEEKNNLNIILFQKNQNLKEKIILLQRKKKEEIETKENKFRETKQYYETLQLKKQEILNRNEQLSVSQEQLIEKFKNLQIKHDEHLIENFHNNEEIIRVSDKTSFKSNEMSMKPQKTPIIFKKNEKLKELDKLNCKKKDLNAKIKLLFETKLEIENKKTPIIPFKTNCKRQSLLLEDEMNKVKNSIEQQKNTILQIMLQIKTMKTQKEEDLEMLDSLKTGIVKQKQILSHQILKNK